MIAASGARRALLVEGFRGVELGLETARTRVWCCCSVAVVDGRFGGGAGETLAVRQIGDGGRVIFAGFAGAVLSYLTLVGAVEV